MMPTSPPKGGVNVTSPLQNAFTNCGRTMT
jgi:hypothetical protein